MQKFQLLLKNEKLKQYRLFALLIITLNVAFFVVLAITRPEIRFRSIALTVLIIILFIIEYFFKKKKKEFSAKAASTLLIIVTYLGFYMWWPAIIMTILAAQYVLSVRRLVVHVNPSFIIYPSFTKKVIEWNELNNIILKDGLLTIDFKNNKIIQQLVEDPTNSVNEKEFNEFCSQQLSKATG